MIMDTITEEARDQIRQMQGEIERLTKQLVSKTEALRKIADRDWGYISPEYATDKSRIRGDIVPGNNIPYMGAWAVIARSALTDEIGEKNS